MIKKITKYLYTLKSLLENLWLSPWKKENSAEDVFTLIKSDLGSFYKIGFFFQHNSDPRDHNHNNIWHNHENDSHLMFWVLQAFLKPFLETLGCRNLLHSTGCIPRYCHLTNVQVPRDWLAATLLLLSCSSATSHRQSLMERFRFIDSSTNQLLRVPWRPGHIVSIDSVRISFYREWAIFRKRMKKLNIWIWKNPLNFRIRALYEVKLFISYFNLFSIVDQVSYCGAWISSLQSIKKFMKVSGSL